MYCRFLPLPSRSPGPKVLAVLKLGAEGADGTRSSVVRVEEHACVDSMVAFEHEHLAMSLIIVLDVCFQKDGRKIFSPQPCWKYKFLP